MKQLVPSDKQTKTVLYLVSILTRFSEAKFEDTDFMVCRRALAQVLGLLITLHSQKKIFFSSEIDNDSDSDVMLIAHWQYTFHKSKDMFG